MYANTADYTFITKWSEEDDAWVSIALEFPSLVCSGKTSREAYHKVYTAAHLMLEGMRKNKEVPPLPFTIRDIKERFSVKEGSVLSGYTCPKCGSNGPFWLDVLMPVLLSDSCMKPLTSFRPCRDEDDKFTCSKCGYIGEERIFEMENLTLRTAHEIAEEEDKYILQEVEKAIQERLDIPKRIAEDTEREIHDAFVKEECEHKRQKLYGVSTSPDGFHGVSVGCDDHFGSDKDEEEGKDESKRTTSRREIEESREKYLKRRNVLFPNANNDSFEEELMDRFDASKRYKHRMRVR